MEGELTAETQRFAEICRDKDLDREGNHSLKKGWHQVSKGVTGTNRHRNCGARPS